MISCPFPGPTRSSSLLHKSIENFWWFGRLVFIVPSEFPIDTFPLLKFWGLVETCSKEKFSEKFFFLATCGLKVIHDSGADYMVDGWEELLSQIKPSLESTDKEHGCDLLSENLLLERQWDQESNFDFR